MDRRREPRVRPQRSVFGEWHRVVRPGAVHGRARDAHDLPDADTGRVFGSRNRPQAKYSGLRAIGNGAEIDNAGMRRLKRDDPRNSGNETPATAAVFRKCLRVVIFVNLNLEQHTYAAFPGF